MDLSAAEWRKASRSKEDGSNCVEVASALDVVAVRDSKVPEGPVLILRRADFKHLTAVLRDS